MLSLEDGRVPVILFYNGTFSPVHSGHRDTLEAARACIDSTVGPNNERYQVVGAFMSPCGSHYAYGKLKGSRVATRHRLEMCRRAIADLPWAIVDTNETFQKRFLSPKHTARALHERMCAARPDLASSLRVGWVTGLEGLPHVPAEDRPWLSFVCVENRDGDGDKTATLRNALLDMADPHVLLAQGGPLGLSSTQVRKACGDGAPLDRFYAEYNLHAVAAYIKEHSLWSIPVALAAVEGEDILIPRGLSAYDHDTVCALLQPAGVHAMMRAWAARRGLPEPPLPLRFSVERVGAGRGWRGSLKRLANIEWAQDADAPVSREPWPSSLIFKLNFMPHEARNSLHEHAFYSIVAPSCPLRVPRCYGSWFRPDHKVGALLLEDLGVAHFSYDYVSMELMSERHLVLAVRALAEFHATWWQSPALDQPHMSWLRSMALSDEDTAAFRERIEYVWGKLSVHASGYLSRAGHDAFTLLAVNVGAIQAKLAAVPQTFYHGDTWTNNVFFPRSISADPRAAPAYDGAVDEDISGVVFLDWQTCGKGCGLVDVGTLMTTAGICDAETESRVLGVYYDTLLRYGVHGDRFSPEDCARAYHLGRAWSVINSFPHMDCFTSNDGPVGARVRNFLRDVGDRMAHWLPALLAEGPT